MSAHRTFRIGGRSLGGPVYFTGRTWHWSHDEAKTWKTRKGAEKALAALTEGTSRCATMFHAGVEEVTP